MIPRKCINNYLLKFTWNNGHDYFLILKFAKKKQMITTTTITSSALIMIAPNISIRCPPRTPGSLTLRWTNVLVVWKHINKVFATIATLRANNSTISTCRSTSSTKHRHTMIITAANPHRACKITPWALGPASARWRSVSILSRILHQMMTGKGMIARALLICWDSAVKVR